MKTLPSSRTQRFNTGFLAGLGAGLVASGLMLLLSVTFNGISLPEVFGAALTQLMPPSLFNTLHQIIGGDAKHYFFYGILVGQCLVFALSGGLCTLIVGATGKDTRPQTGYPGSSLQKPAGDSNQTNSVQGQLQWTTGILLAFLLWLLVGLLFLPLTGVGLFGSQLVIGSVNTMLSLAVVGLAFGLLFVLLQNWFVVRRLRREGATKGEIEKANVSRRVVLARSFELIGLSVLGLVAWRFITNGMGSGGTNAANVPTSQLLQRFKRKIVPAPTPNYGDIKQVPNLSAEVTSNDQYYVVSKNLFSDPMVSAASWSLTVDGQVEHPYTLSYDEVMALPRKQQYESMMCISNEVGGQYMSNALWEGIPLKDLLARAGAIQPGAANVVLYAADDYSDSIHLSKALEPTTLLAVHMNGKLLPQGHGFPARLLVPGIYGMKHVKWVTRIEVVNTSYQGYWEQRGWSQEAPVHMTSRIDTPLTGSTLNANQQTYVAGVAFSGNKGISEVDVSFDAGNSWQRATLKRPLSDLTWVLWEIPWRPARGSYTLIVRAIDLEGNVQDPSVAPPLPDGSSGYDGITVTVQ